MNIQLNREHLPGNGTAVTQTVDSFLCFFAKSKKKNIIVYDFYDSYFMCSFAPSESDFLLLTNKGKKKLFSRKNIVLILNSFFLVLLILLNFNPNKWEFLRNQWNFVLMRENVYRPTYRIISIQQFISFFFLQIE